jgi:uncharacterized protein (TIGR02757 family)
MSENLKELLEELVIRFNRAEFIEGDPISVPHEYSIPQDIEISGFWTAMLAWGKRSTIIAKAKELFKLMDDAPYDFILNHSEEERKPFLNFKHRTFQPADTLYFLEFLQWFYQRHHSLEEAFAINPQREIPDATSALKSFHQLFFSLPFAPERTRKHVPSPDMNSACKKLNLFLRWMVRKDGCGVDFGLWEKITPSQLLIPLDVHVERIARQFGLLERKQTDWTAVKELTQHLRYFDSTDPVKYDYALFGLGVLEKSRQFVNASDPFGNRGKNFIRNGF